MKNYTPILFLIPAFAMLSACAENNLADYKAEKPEDIAKYEYLNDYSTLSSYLEEGADQTFRLGAAVNASDMIDGGRNYSLVTTNFNEITPKDAMCHSACVQSSGLIDLLNVKKLVAVAQKSNLSVFGGALCSYKQQNNSYLNGLLADKPLPEEKNAKSRASGMKTEYLVNTDFENGLKVDKGSWSAWGDAIKKHGNFWKVVDGEGYNKSKGYRIEVGAGYAASKGQTVVQFSPEIPAVENTTYYLTLKVKASKKCSITAEFRANGSSTPIGKFSSSINVTTDWQEVTVSCPSVVGNIYRFYLNVGTVGGTIWFDDLSVYYQVATGIPLTPEEKADTLTWAMNNWIKGMMEACNGAVTNWAVLDEPLALVDSDKDGYYDLRSESNGDADSYFYWGDYLGENYPRIVVDLARKYAATDLKLYVNETDLITDTKKLKSVVHWINQWESDGKTVIDGIATTLHLSCMVDETAQAAQEERIKEAFVELAATGKLVRISELDMKIVDLSGAEISTLDLTFEQEQKMADFYKFVLSVYAQQIPASQRGGITVWSVADSNNVPNGLWSDKYIRKPAYAGFVEGLKAISGR